MGCYVRLGVEIEDGGLIRMVYSEMGRVRGLFHPGVSYYFILPGVTLSAPSGWEVRFRDRAWKLRWHWHCYLRYQTSAPWLRRWKRSLSPHYRQIIFNGLWLSAGGVTGDPPPGVDG